MTKRFMPKSVIDTETDSLLKIRNRLLKACGELTHDMEKLRCYVVDQGAGRFYSKHDVVTVPLWAFNSSKKGYKSYYLAHEIAHKLTLKYHGDGNSHNQYFMQQFIKVCPKTVQHYEHEYKPRNATIAGISKRKAK